MNRTLTHQEVEKWYDRFGARLDRHVWFENPGIEFLLGRGRFETARAVFELGFGTGRLASELLHRLPPTAHYHGVDLSETMVEIARKRLAEYGERVSLEKSDGRFPVDQPSQSCDRFVATYVLDLLSHDDIHAVVAEARRVLIPGGLLCVASLSKGATRVSRGLTRLWTWIHRLRPQLVGGCRAIRIGEFLDPDEWQVESQVVLTPRGILSTESVVAARL